MIIVRKVCSHFPAPAPASSLPDTVRSLPDTVQLIAYILYKPVHILA